MLETNFKSCGMRKQIEAYWRSDLQIINLYLLIKLNSVETNRRSESVYLSTTDQPFTMLYSDFSLSCDSYGELYNTYPWRNNRIVQKLNYSASIRRNRRLVAAVLSLRSIFVAFCIYNFKRVFKNNANPLSFVGISNCIIKFAPSVWQIF